MLNFSEIFKKVIPSLNIIDEPTLLINIQMKNEKILFANKNSYMFIQYSLGDVKKFIKLEGVVTNRSIIDALKDELYYNLLYSRRDFNTVIVDDIKFDKETRYILAELR
jgi:hypothetical protein